MDKTQLQLCLSVTENLLQRAKVYVESCADDLKPNQAEELLSEIEFYFDTRRNLQPNT